MTERSQDTARFVLRMENGYLPIPPLIRDSGCLVAIFVIPVWMIGYEIHRHLTRRPDPPHLVIALTPSKLAIHHRRRDDGLVTELEFPRDSVVELRKNRLADGLWVHAREGGMHTIAQDIDAETITSICDAVACEASFPRVKDDG